MIMQGNLTVDTQIMPKYCPIISVIIPAKNSEEFIFRCLESLKQQTFDPKFFEVIVVNNLSTDSTVETVESFGFSLIESYATSAAGVRNMGAEFANGKILAFLDSDCIAPPEWLEVIHNVFANGRNSELIVGGTCLSPKDGTFVEKNWAPNTTFYEGPVNALPGANMSLEKSAFFRLGGFCDRLKTAEDDEICKRARAFGFQIISKRNLAVVHLGYPKSLVDLFRKMVSQSETQLIAHGFFGDKVVILTWVWISLLMLTPAALYLNLPWWLAVIALIIPPFIFTIARLRRTTYRNAVTLVPKTFLIALTALSGRAWGLGSEIYKKMILGYREKI
ncbi:glycosyltransferase [Marinobacter sp.]|uniref:glycosyltransferase n=1 Tax=Marinobacter sp. TaxID=50741 RepID=UPI00356492A4